MFQPSLIMDLNATVPNMDIEKKIADFWIYQDATDLKNYKKWEKLSKNLETQGIICSVAELQHLWETKVDARLEMIYKVQTGWSFNTASNTTMSPEDKWTNFQKRLSVIKQLVRQKEEQESFTVSMEMRSFLPIDFVTTKNYRQPPLLFWGLEFFLLEPQDDFTGMAFHFALEYLIMIHGGKIIHDLANCNNQTIFIASSESSRNFKHVQVHGGTLYSPSLVYDHARNQIAPNAASIKDHIWIPEIGFSAMDASKMQMYLGTKIDAALNRADSRYYSSTNANLADQKLEKNYKRKILESTMFKMARQANSFRHLSKIVSENFEQLHGEKVPEPTLWARKKKMRENLKKIFHDLKDEFQLTEEMYKKLADILKSKIC